MHDTEYKLAALALFDPALYDLVRRMLRISPAARISAADALQHPYLAQPFEHDEPAQQGDAVTGEVSMDA